MFVSYVLKLSPMLWQDVMRQIICEVALCYYYRVYCPQPKTANQTQDEGLNAVNQS